MFRFYSSLFPTGRPEIDVLLGAKKVAHEWDFSQDPPMLHIPGVFPTTTLFFFATGPLLYLLQPGQLVSVSCPGALGDFVIHHGQLKGVQSSRLFVSAAKDNDISWKDYEGKSVDLLALDQKHFGDAESETLPLPLRLIFSSDRRHMYGCPFLTLPTLLQFLRETEGALSGSMELVDQGWLFTVRAGSLTFSTVAESFTLDFHKAQRGIKLLSDNTMELKMTRRSKLWRFFFRSKSRQ